MKYFDLLLNTKLKYPYIILAAIIFIIIIIMNILPIQIMGDSLAYLSGADNLVKGNGFSIYKVWHYSYNDLTAPITDYQPAYNTKIEFESTNFLFIEIQKDR